MILSDVPVCLQGKVKYKKGKSLSQMRPMMIQVLDWKNLNNGKSTE
jgi:hypothetical protein